MKFDYCYRTKDNVEHWGRISAPNRECVYKKLKESGIRPGRVVETPGFLNLVIGKGKRWIALGVLGFLLLLSLFFMVAMHDEAEVVVETITNQTRRQPIGDAAFIEMGIRTGWADVFECDGDRFLASFAIPGVPAGVRSTSEDEIRKALSRVVSTTKEDGIEVRQIKAMVEGMKNELRDFLSDGGTIVEYGTRLVKRQEEEMSYYRRAQNEVNAMLQSGASADDVLTLWEKKNAQLRGMGIRLIPLPE